MSFASILSAEYAEQLLKTGRPSDINQQPIGTGPFVFQRYQKDSQIRYKANRAYWAPEQVKLDNLVFSINVDPSVRIQKLRRNECQVTLHPRPADLPGLKQDTNVQVLQQAGFNLGYIAYNTQHPPFDRLEVRQAMDMAVNKQAILQAVYQAQDNGRSTPCRPPSGPTTLASPMHRTTRKKPASCSNRPGSSLAPKSLCGPCRCNAPTTPTPS